MGDSGQSGWPDREICCKYIFWGKIYLYSVNTLSKRVQARGRNRKDKAPEPFFTVPQKQKWNVYPDRVK